MSRFDKIAIIGVGLIGGSIGLAAKKRCLAKEVVGIFRKRSSLAKAVKRRAIDWGTLDFKKGVSGAEVVVVATDVGAITKLSNRISPFMTCGSILTDVGSVKSSLANEIESNLPKGISFVGSHPMAGSEKAGVGFADPELFEGAISILTKTQNTDKRALKTIEKFWRDLGSKVVIMDPRTHDKTVAMISHLPHMAAVALCLSQSRGDLSYTGSGFKDTTRIASSDPDMWRDILKTNRLFAIKALDRFISEICAIRENLSHKDFDLLLSRMKRAKAIRDSVK